MVSREVEVVDGRGLPRRVVTTLRGWAAAVRAALTRPGVERAEAVLMLKAAVATVEAMIENARGVERPELVWAQAWRIVPWTRVADGAGEAGRLGMAAAAARMEARGWLLREGGCVLGLPLRTVGGAGFRAAPSVAQIRDAIGLPLERDGHLGT